MTTKKEFNELVEQVEKETIKDEKKEYNVYANYMNDLIKNKKITNEEALNFLEAIEGKNKEFEKEFAKNQGFDSIGSLFSEAMKLYKEHKKIDESIADIEIRSLKTMIDDGIPEVKWRVENLIPDRGVTIIGGTSGARKTWVAMQIALCCASGTNFLDHFETTKCNVLYVDEENGNITIPNRFFMLKEGHKFEAPFDNLFISIFNGFKLDDKLSIIKLELLIEKYDPKLIVFDSMVRCMIGEEDKSTDVRKIFDNLKPILVEKDIGFIILHHTTKGRSKGIDTLRGSGDFVAFADVIMMFESKNSFCNVDIVKNRHIDRSQLAGFCIKFESVNEDKYLQLQYFEKSPEEKCAVDNCIVDIRDWYDNNNIQDFKKRHVGVKMSELGHKKNTINTALKILIEKQELSKLTRGNYKVENPLFKGNKSEEVEGFE